MSELKIGVALVHMCRRPNVELYVLLGKRVKEYGSGLWVLPGGRREPGESPGQTAAREHGEETGIQIYPSEVADLTFEYVEEPGREPFLMLYTMYLQTLGREQELPTVVPEPKEFSELRWFTLREFLDNRSRMWDRDVAAICAAHENLYGSDPR